MSANTSSSFTRAIMSQPVWLLPVLSLLLVTFVKYTRSRRSLKGLRLPPGPKPLPIIGNALDVPTTDMGAKFREMTQKHGAYLVWLYPP